MSELSVDFASILFSEISDSISNFATNLERSRRAVWASVAQSEEEKTAISQAIDNFKYVFSLVGSAFKLSRLEGDELPIEKLLSEGKPIPYSGGVNGMVTHLDGTQTVSKVPKNLQGTPLPDYAWDPMPAEEETRTMLETVVPDMISDQAQKSQGVISRVKEYLLNKFSKGGNK